jgi:hypothetical protein
VHRRSCTVRRLLSGSVQRMISVFEQRRREPLYFATRAAGALRSASVLSKADLWDGFTREGSLALELIIKAVIAQRLELGEDLGSITRVPATHKIPELWSQAKLPELPPADYGRLVSARVFLMWAGRYPAPNRDADGERDHADLWEYSYDQIPTSSMFRKPQSFDWDDVDRIYSVANDFFWALRRDHGL